VRDAGTMFVGSPTMHATGRTPASRMSAISSRTPKQPTSSSKLKAKWKANGASLARNASAFATAVAMKPFMSAEPRAYSRPSFTVPDSGSIDHSWPSHGTVSVWPDRITPAGLPSPRVANRLALVLPAS
jgi:hypothetical protein